MRGLVLKLLAWLVSVGFLRNLLLAKVRKDARIHELPVVTP